MKGFRQTAFLAVLVLVAVSASACATGGVPAVPLPKEIKINPPSPETTKELASCLGAWGGWWTWMATGNTTETALIVESIDAKSAQVVYARGRGADGSPGWWSRSLAEIEGGSIVFRWGSIVRTFTCKGNSVAGTYEQGGRTTGYAELTKFALPVSLVTPAAAKAEPAEPSDPATAEKLIAGSPFGGTAAFPAGTFDVEFTFSKDEKGVLQGELTRTTSRAASPGPLRWVKAKGDKVTFTTELGVEYTLRFDNGNLIGKAHSSFGDGEVKLRPKR